MGAANILGLLQRLESADLAIDQYRCVVVRNRNVTCKHCAEACTSGCIGVENGQLVLKPALCVGCGTCATVCPTGAITARMPTDAELLDACLEAQRNTQGLAVIACGKMTAAARGAFDSDKVVGVTCLGRIDESLLLQLAAQGAQRIVLSGFACETCERSAAIPTIDTVVRTANLLLETWGYQARVHLQHTLPAKVKLTTGDSSYDSDKRQFFGSLKEKLKDELAAGLSARECEPSAIRPEQAGESPAQPIVKVTADGTLPHFVPGRRKTLLQALAASGEPQQATISTRLWGRVAIDLETCTGCRMCTTFCPTGALARFDEEDGAFGIEHTPSLCVKCKACQDTCRHAALTVLDETPSSVVANGLTERFEMERKRIVETGPHSATNAMRRLLHSPRVYER